MSNLIFYSPTRFNSLSDRPDVKTWLTLFKIFPPGVSFVDRTGIIKIPIRTATPAQVSLPTPDPTFNLSFGDCAINRAKEIYQKHLEHGVPIRLQWSGGIDSSAALAAFIQLLGVAESKRCLEIVMTSEGIIENPFMWEQVIRKEEFKIVNTMKFTEQWNGDAIMVNGEGGDQVQGTDLYRGIIQQHGAQAFTVLWTEGSVVEFIKFKGKVTEQDARDLAVVLINQVKQAPIEIVTLADFWWWINFTCKWASTFYRIVTKTTRPITADFIDNYFFPFYSSKDFQLWSMYKRDEKHKGNWATYKWKAKDFVCDFLGDDSYQAKHRQGSLAQVLSQSSRAEAIDDEFNFYDKLNPGDWYTPNNSFRT
jgi:hypothetical protein